MDRSRYCHLLVFTLLIASSSNPGGSLRFPSYSDILRSKASNRLLQRVINIFMRWRFPLTLLRGSTDFCNIFVTSQIFSKTCVSSWAWCNPFCWGSYPTIPSIISCAILGSISIKNSLWQCNPRVVYGTYLVEKQIKLRSTILKFTSKVQLR